MTDVYRLADQFRQQVLDRERAALRRLVERYGRAYQALDDEAFRWYRKIEARAAELGVGIRDVSRSDPSWPFRLENIQAQQAAIAKRMADLAASGTNVVDGLQGEGVRMGIEHARDLAAEQGAARLRTSQGELRERAKDAIRSSWQVPHESAFEALVGQTADGTPLQTLFERAAGESAHRLTDALQTGFALGQNPRQIARSMRTHLGGNLNRALLIARTETIRAYRLGQIASFRDNSRIVGGWVWHSALDERTCLGCIMQHGQRFDLDAVLSDHPRGRCAMVPDTVGWDDLADTLTPGGGDPTLTPKMRASLTRARQKDDWIRDEGDLPTLVALEKRGYLEYGDPARKGLAPRARQWRITDAGRAAAGGGDLSELAAIPDTKIVVQTGADWLNQQAVPVQLRIMGPTRTAMFRSGQFRPEHFVTHRLDPVWGPSVRPTPLRELDADPARLADWRRQGQVLAGRSPAPVAERAIVADAAEETVPATDRSRWLIQAAPDSPRYVQEVAEVVGEGVTTHQQAIEAGAIVRAEMLNRVDHALGIRRVTLPDPEIERLERRLKSAKADLAYYRKDFGPTAHQTETAKLRVQERADELAERRALNLDREGTIAELRADVDRRIAELEDVKREAQQALDQARGMAESDAARNRFLQANNELFNLRQLNRPLWDLEDDVRQAAVKEVLAEVRATNEILQAWEKGGNAAVKKAVDQDVQQFFPRAWLQRSADSGTMKTGKVKRGFYSPGRPADLKISGEPGTQDFLDTVAHEMGHRMEDTIRAETRITRLQTQGVTVTTDPVLAQEILDRQAALRANLTGFAAKQDEWIRYVDDLQTAGRISADAGAELKSGLLNTLQRDVETLRPGILELEQALYEEWTAGSKAVHKDKGVFRATRDGVADWPIEYAGKSYPGGAGTYRFFEIFTTGLEAVRGGGIYRYGSKRIDFVGANPQHLDFTLGLLIGVP